MNSIINEKNMNKPLPFTLGQRNVMAALTCIITDTEYIAEPEPDFVQSEASYVDNSRDILGLNIASRFGGKQ